MRRFFGRLRAPLLYLGLVGLLGWGAFIAPVTMRSNIEGYFPLNFEIEPATALVGSSQQKPGTTTAKRAGSPYRSERARAR
jgi:hypothetical protein